MTKNKNGKEKIFTENERVIIKPFSGKKLKGRVSFVNNSTIQIKDKFITLDSIKTIRRNPIVKSTAKALCLSAGTLAFISLPWVALSASGDTAAFFLGTYAVGVSSYAGIKIIERKHRNSKWTYRIIDSESD
uniref:hypothetical protein n=1 Tax=Gelidibacter sp. TaxID=2018083 RepID=UPI00404B6ACC